MMKRIVQAALWLALSSPAVSQSALPAATGQKMSAAARAYLEEALALFQKNHINASTANWSALRAQAYATAAGAQTPADVYPAVKQIIASLGEKHTIFLTADEGRARETGAASGAAAAPELMLPEAMVLKDRTAFVRIYPFAGSSAQASTYAELGRRAIARAKAEGACRFIVDLRPNAGGNMYPMIDSLSGLLDDGRLGSFVDGGGKPLGHWGVRNGAAFSTETALARAAHVRNERFPVAVLLGPRTASAGEDTAISFVGRPHTRFFGSLSAGYTSANEVMKLSDGSMIYMTSSWTADRNGKMYKGSLRPDLETAYGGPTVDAAANWIRRQPCPR